MATQSPTQRSLQEFITFELVCATPRRQVGRIAPRSRSYASYASRCAPRTRTRHRARQPHRIARLALSPCHAHTATEDAFRPVDRLPVLRSRPDKFLSTRGNIPDDMGAKKGMLKNFAQPALFASLELPSCCSQTDHEQPSQADLTRAWLALDAEPSAWRVGARRVAVRARAGRREAAAAHSCHSGGSAGRPREAKNRAS